MTDPSPDAVLVPLCYSGNGDAASRLSRLQAEFSPILKTPLIFVRHQGTRHFLTGNPDDTILFPHSDPRSGQPRYTWSDRGDGVAYGRCQSDEF